MTTLHPSGAAGTAPGLACRSCSLVNYCMHWCGCTNYFSTGDYNTVGPFMCASEKAALHVAFDMLKIPGDEGIVFPEHLTGTPVMHIISEMYSAASGG